MSMADTARWLDGMEQVQRNIHAWAKGKGFWDEGLEPVIDDGCMGEQRVMIRTRPTNIGEKLALIHSEVSEALEAHRNHKNVVALDPKDNFEGSPPINAIYYKSGKDVYYPTAPPLDPGQVRETPKPEGVAIELADAVIRIMDLCEYLQIDLGRAILEKMSYNATRPHKHGRAY